MNSKAKRQQIEFPPLLNLSKDRPHVDSSFRNVEKNNSPFLNSMIQPFYRKETNTKSVYDRAGNEYHLDNGSLYKNGELLTNVADKKFVKKEVTAEFKNIDSFDTNGTSKAYITKKGECYWDDSLYDKSLLSTDIIIESRVRIIDNEAIYVIYFDRNNTEYVRLIRRAGSKIANTLTSQWYETVWLNSSSASTLAISRTNVDPCIHIGKNNGIVYVSLTAYTGEVMPCAAYYGNKSTGTERELISDSAQSIFQTFALDTTPHRLTSFNSTNTYTMSSTKQLTDIVAPAMSVNTTVSTRTVVTNNYIDYYIYNASAVSVNTLTKVRDIPRNYNFTQRNMQQKLDDTWYDVLQFREYVITLTLSVKGSGDLYYAWKDAQLYISNLNNDGLDGSLQLPNAMGGTMCRLIQNNTILEMCSTADAYPYDSLSGVFRTNLGESTISISYKYYQGQAVPQFRYTSGSVGGYYSSPGYTDTDSAGWNQLVSHAISSSEINKLKESNYTNKNTQLTARTCRAIVNPNVILDDGYFYSVCTFNYPYYFNETSAWSQFEFELSGYLNGLNAKGEIGYLSGDSLSTPINKFITLRGYCLRGLSLVVDQNFYAITFKMCTRNSAAPTADSELSTARFCEGFYSNAIDEIRYLPGTSRKSNFNYYSLMNVGDPGITGSGIGASEDLLTFTTGGFRTRIPNSNFNILFNIFNSGFALTQGLSYSSLDSEIGTLLTPWQSIDEHSYVTANGDKLWYRNKDNRWYEISIEDGAELSTILEDRMILINTTSYTNIYDSEKERFFHYAPDYNGRLMHGTLSASTISGVVQTKSDEYSQYTYIRYTGSAINPLYETMPRDVITSMILPIVPRYRCFAGVEKAYKSWSNDEAQGIDVFYSDYSVTTCKYRFTIQINSVYVKHELQGLNYPGTTSTSAVLTPNIFTKYINGAGNNDIVLEDYDAYTMTYYDNQPYLLYSASTQVSNLYNDTNSFFVLQGQFYGIIGDKLYSLIYSNGAISGMDAIIDLGDLQFIGNNPMIAFFYDPATRVIRSFTGDANLETLYSATKIKKYYNSWYDETTQSIFAATDAGLLVFGPRNTFMLEDYKNTSLVQFSNDGVTHITNDDVVDNLVYYETEGYEPIPIDFETSFYGLGATESTSIDRWNITLYDLEGNHPSTYVTVGVRSLTDITVKSEEKTYKITPDMYDKWSNSVFIAYNPKLIKGQGIRLYVKTPLTIQSITAHIMDNGTGTTTQRSV